MLTLGVDLATVAQKTAACVVDWPGTPGALARISLIRTPATDDDIMSLAADVEIVGIDSPFGWPRAWADAVGRHKPGEPFVATGAPALITRRATDLWVAETLKIYPLSVAADRIGSTAIRCVRLIHRLGMPIDLGTSHAPPLVTEVYPAAALLRWGLSYRLYKGRQLGAARKLLVNALEAAGLPLQLSDDDRVVLESNDDALDALVCALVARAVGLGLTDDVPESVRQSGSDEGWIRVPSIGVTLGMLTNGVRASWPSSGPAHSEGAT